jgi:hypothetical protein
MLAPAKCAVIVDLTEASSELRIDLARSEDRHAR